MHFYMSLWIKASGKEIQCNPVNMNISAGVETPPHLFEALLQTLELHDKLQLLGASVGQHHQSVHQLIHLLVQPPHRTHCISGGVGGNRNRSSEPLTHAPPSLTHTLHTPLHTLNAPRQAPAERVAFFSQEQRSFVLGPRARRLFKYGAAVSRGLLVSDERRTG